MKRLNLSASLGVAVREFPTSTGEVDYALFVDGKPVGVVEAKREEAGQHITDVEVQSGRYANSTFKWIKNEYKDLVTVDSVLMLMDMFAMPYKAVVLRLFESGNISHQQAEKLLEVGSADVMERVSLTGKAKRWQLDGKGTESFGTLLEKVEYNRQHEYLTESREKEDVAYVLAGYAE